jgi:hypothetical protein
LTALADQFILPAYVDSAIKNNLACKAGNRRKNEHSSVAQLVEQVAVNHLVGGSNPSRGASFFQVSISN